MDNSLTLTFNELCLLLDDFREWYEFEWLNDNREFDDYGMSAPNYWIAMKRQDPCWPDRMPEER